MASKQVRLLVLCLLPPLLPPALGAQTPVTFVDTTIAAGVGHEHAYLSPLSTGPEDNDRRYAGGVAAGDYDGDGWVDLYAVRGDIGPNSLFRNRGDGTFEEVAAALGVAIDGAMGAGPVFGDVDGDGWLDLFIGGVRSTDPRLFRNVGGALFEEITSTAGLDTTLDTFSGAYGDYDLDGDLDLFLTHWNPSLEGVSGHLWQNQGGGTFTEVDSASGVDAAFGGRDYSWSACFADIDNDALPDILIASDFDRSSVLLNQGDGSFADATDPAVITDEFGMGSAVADYDNDGDLDWFVTSIYSEDCWAEDKCTGNRLYRNLGDGTFEDVTEIAGVRDGGWGWGACFADFDNDGHLDLFHVNGNRPNSSVSQLSRLFLSDGDGTFTERAVELGLVDDGAGRGVVCFDYDRDGDTDVFVSKNSAAAALYRNDGGNTAGNWLALELSAPGPGNVHAVGARVYVTAGGVTQMREVHVGSNFESQNPLAVHFGLGAAAVVDELAIHWPAATVLDTHDNVPTGRFLAVTPAGYCTSRIELGDLDVTSQETVEACGEIVVGSGVAVRAPTGELRLLAGDRVSFGNGLVIEPGAALTIEIDPSLLPG